MEFPARSGASVEMSAMAGFFGWLFLAAVASIAELPCAEGNSADIVCLPSLCSDVLKQPQTDEFSSYRFCCSTECTCTDTLCHTGSRDCLKTASAAARNMTFVEEKYVACMRVHLRDFTDSFLETSPFPEAKDPYNVIIACPLSYSEENSTDRLVGFNVDKCDNAENHTEFDTRVPVSDVRTGLTYRNKYCAMCHGVTVPYMKAWDPTLICQSEYFWPDRYDNIVNDILGTRSCNILFNQPENVSGLSKCTKSKSEGCNNYNASCYRDDVLGEVACVFRGTFRPWCGRNNDLTEGFTVTFSLLLSNAALETELQTDDHDEVSHAQFCDKDAFWDELKNVCRNLTCVAPKKLQNGTCLTQNIITASFEFHLRMTPIQTVTDRRSVSNSIVRFMQNFLAKYSFDQHYRITTYAKMDASERKPVDNYYVEYYVLVIKAAAGDASVDVKFIDGALELDKTFQSPIDSGHDFFTELVQITQGSNDTIINNIDTYDVLTLLHSFEINFNRTYMVFLQPTSGCPLVNLTATEFEIERFSWGIHIEDIRANISNWNFLENVVSDELISVMVCVDNYSSLIEPILASNKSLQYLQMTRLSTSAAGILSLVCTCLSIICLLLTLLTYGLFKDMRTQPGVNNMALCFSLILAQTLFQFGIGQKENVPKWACEAIGILVHFFWLNAIMWMNVSSIHSCRVFWGIATIQNNNSSLKTTALYFIYALLIAALPVVITILISVHSDESSLGYGKVICYISEQENVWRTFALPVGLFIFINIILFVAVAIKICKLSSKGPSTIKERQYFKVCARISSLTGFLWTFGFLYIFTGKTVLQYLFIICNASQGVFIFIAFVCNKICFRKYLKLISGYRLATSVATRTTDVQAKSDQ